MRDHKGAVGSCVGLLAACACAAWLAAVMSAAGCGSSSSGASSNPCQTGTIACHGGMTLKFCQNSADECTYWVGVGAAAVSEGSKQFYCESCDDLSSCQETAVAYCEGTGFDAGDGTYDAGDGTYDAGDGTYDAGDGTDDAASQDAGATVAVTCSGAVNSTGGSCTTATDPIACGDYCVSSGDAFICPSSGSYLGAEFATGLDAAEACGSACLSCDGTDALVEVPASWHQPCCAPLVSCSYPPCPPEAPSCDAVSGSFGATGQYACYAD